MLQEKTDSRGRFSYFLNQLTCVNIFVIIIVIITISSSNNNNKKSRTQN